MKWRSLDWKFFLTFSVAIVAIVVPLVWQSDLSSKSIELRLKSSASLQPASQIRDVQLVLDGKKLESPYSSTLELVNTGAKTVMSKDFDRPIEIVLGEGTQIVTARVTDTSPSDLPIETNSSERVISITPHLSNPGDTISLSVITSGAEPVYTVRARIAGISKISYVDLTLPKSKYFRYLKPVIFGLAAWAVFIVNVLFFVAFWQRRLLRVPRAVSIFGSLATYVGGALLMKEVMDGFDFRNHWEIYIPVMVVAAVLSFLFCTVLLTRWYRLVNGIGPAPTRHQLDMAKGVENSARIW